MQIIENMVIENVRNGNNLEPKKIDGVVYCKECGMEYFESQLRGYCNICNGDEFLSGDLASTLAGYKKLDEAGNLKRYYKEKYGRNSIIKMNSKRIILWMLIRDKLIKENDKEMEDVINRVMWKKW